MPEAEGAVIEIVERRSKHVDGPMGDIIIPDEIRINGQPLLCPTDHPVKVHEVTIGPDAVLVTLTVFAKRIVVGVEEPEPEESRQDPRLARVWQQPDAQVERG